MTRPRTVEKSHLKDASYDSKLGYGPQPSVSPRFTITAGMATTFTRHRSSRCSLWARMDGKADAFDALLTSLAPWFP